MCLRENKRQYNFYAKGIVESHPINTWFRALSRRLISWHRSLPVQNPWLSYKFKHTCQVTLILSHIIKIKIYLVKKWHNLKHHWPSSFLGHQFRILASLSNMLTDVFVFFTQSTRWMLKWYLWRVTATSTTIYRILWSPKSLLTANVWMLTSQFFSAYFNFSSQKQSPETLKPDVSIRKDHVVSCST